MRSSDPVVRISQADSTLSEHRTILIADDDSGIRFLLVTLCEEMGYSTVEATNGREAVDLVTARLPDLVIMDAVMPELDGFSATQQLKESPDTSHIPILILTGLRSRKDRLKGIAAGATDLLAKPIDSEELMLRVRNNLKVKELNDLLQRHNEILEQQVSDRTKQLTEAVETLKTAQAEIEDSHRDTIFRLSALAEFRDEDTGAHIRRIGYFARQLSVAMGLDPAFQETIFHAAMLHDIGKVAVPDAVLLKKGGLTESDWEVMKTHAQTGARILAESQSPYLRMGAEIAMNHHERFDGSGYPNGLIGEAIPLSARITSVADVYDALRAERPYKPPFSHDEAVEIMTRGDGRTKPEHFDPRVLEAFRRSSESFRAIFDTHQDR